MLCPNCSSPVDSSPVRCRRCGYRPEMAREYFWLYAGGGALVLLGFLLGAAGVAAEGAGPGHWSRDFRGWFPIAPWPEGYTWLAFIVAGIALTLGGLGVTRRRLDAWALLLAVSINALALTVLALVGWLGEPGAAAKARILLAPGAGVLALVLRLGLALWRTPPGRVWHRHQPSADRQSL